MRSTYSRLYIEIPTEAEVRARVAQFRQPPTPETISPEVSTPGSLAGSPVKQSGAFFEHLHEMLRKHALTNVIEENHSPRYEM